MQRLSNERLLDARALLDSGRCAAAYYLAGYAVECLLKSCVLAHIEKTGALFRDRKYLRSLADCWTHDLGSLVDLAALTVEFGKAQAANPFLAANWGVVRSWSETSRYEDRPEADARSLLNAIIQDPNGVLRWRQAHS